MGGFGLAGTIFATFSDWNLGLQIKIESEVVVWSEEKADRDDYGSSYLHDGDNNDGGKHHRSGEDDRRRC